MATIGISLVALVMSLIPGTVSAMMSQSPHPVLRLISAGYIAAIRATPLLVQIYFIY